MIVVDATIWVDALLDVLPDAQSDLITTYGCCSPPHVDFEVGSALLRLERRGVLQAGEAELLIEVFSSHPVERIRQPHDATSAIEFLNNSTYADAWYLALAKRLGSPLMTADSGMKESAKIHDVKVLS